MQQLPAEAVLSLLRLRVTKMSFLLGFRLSQCRSFTCPFGSGKRVQALSDVCVVPPVVSDSRFLPLVVIAWRGVPCAVLRALQERVLSAEPLHRLPGTHLLAGKHFDELFFAAYGKDQLDRGNAERLS